MTGGGNAFSSNALAGRGEVEFSRSHPKVSRGAMLEVGRFASDS